MCQVIDPLALIGPKIEQVHKKKLEEAREEAVANAIETVRVNIMMSNEEGKLGSVRDSVNIIFPLQISGLVL